MVLHSMIQSLFPVRAAALLLPELEAETPEPETQ